MNIKEIVMPENKKTEWQKKYDDTVEELEKKFNVKPDIILDTSVVDDDWRIEYRKQLAFDKENQPA